MIIEFLKISGIVFSTFVISYGYGYIYFRYPFTLIIGILCFILPIFFGGYDNVFSQISKDITISDLMGLTLLILLCIFAVILGNQEARNNLLLNK